MFHFNILPEYGDKINKKHFPPPHIKQMHQYQNVNTGIPAKPGKEVSSNNYNFPEPWLDISKHFLQ